MSTQIRIGEILNFNANVIGSTLTGYLSGVGTISSADSILSAIQKLNGNIAAISGATADNPSALIGLTTINGSASTYMRSDAAPAIDTSINPTWSSVHTFTQLTSFSLPSLGTGSEHLGIDLNTSTASTSGAPNQYSPSIRFSSQVWNTAGTPANNIVEFWQGVRCISSSSPTGKLFWSSTISVLGGGSRTDLMSLSSSGVLNIIGLTASSPILTDASKNLISGSLTGTGTVLVTSASPTITSPIAKGLLLAATATSATFSATATATAAQLATGLLLGTGSTGFTLTLPTMSSINSTNSWGQGQSFEFIVDASAMGGSSILTLAVNTGITTLAIVTGSNTLTTTHGSIGMFRLYFSSASTAFLVRLG